MKRYALVVGIGEYEHLKDLSKPGTDAEAVRDVLRASKNFENVALLNEKVTGDRLRSALKTLLWERGKHSDVLIYFTGHGFTAGEDEEDTQGFLATQDCRIEVEGRRVLSARRGLSFRALNGLIAKAELSSLVMLLDCCHSGSFVEKAQAKENLGALEQADYFLVTACRSFEQAYAMRAAEHSVFSTAVLEALRSDDKDRVTGFDVFQRVKVALRDSGQEPIYLGSGTDVPILERRSVVVADEMSEVCPYQGLQAFTPETAAVFFGRAAVTQQLVQKLDRSNFVMVLGPSGSGKSSVVRAGLVTQLMAQSWQVITMKPDAAPLAILKMELRKLLVASGVTAGEIRALLGFDSAQPTEGIGHRTLSGVEGWLQQADLKLLLLVDQFEEVFTLCDQAERQRFVEVLLAVRDRAGARLAVVATMRSDFVNEWLALGYPAAVVERDVVWLEALTGEDLRDAILKPAQARGYAFGEGLLDLLLENVAAEHNCLPLLEFALTELWEKRDTQARKLTASAYREMGGLKGALDRRAETVYNSLREVDKPWAKRICLRLVRLGKGEKDTRQRQPKEALLAMGGGTESKNEQQQKTREIVNDVITSLVAGRLLVSDGEFVDLAHEALLEGWAQFVSWRQEDRDLRRLVQRLEDAHKEWQAKEESDQYLMSGGLLLELKEQWSELAKILSGKRGTELEDYFLLSDEQEQQNVNKLKQALAKAQLQEASREVRDKLLFNPGQTVEATVDAINLVGESQEKFDQVTPPAQDALHRAWFSIRECLKIEGHSSSVESVAFSPQGDLIVSGSRDKTLRLWDLEGNMVAPPFKGHSASVYSVAFSPQGDCIVSGSHDQTLRLWDLEGNAIGSPFEGHNDWVYSVAFSPQGDRIVSGSRDNTLRLWDLAGNAIGSPFEGHSSSVHSVAFSPQGDRIVSGSRDRRLRLWDLEGNLVGSPFKGHDHWIYSVAFNPQGDRIVSGSRDNTLRLWDLEGNTIGSPFEGHSGSVYSAVFNSQGDRILSSSTYGTLRLWDLAGNAIGSPFEGHSSSVHSVAFSPQGDHIISGGYDKTIRLWNLEGNATSLSFLKRHSGWVYAVAFSPQGDCVASGVGAGTLNLWDLEGNAIGLPFQGHSSSVRSMAFSPQGDRIISASKDETLRLWDLEGNAIGSPFVGHSDSVEAVAFSSQGDRIVSGGRDKTLRLWDLEGNAIGSPLVGHRSWVYSVAFSPQGDRIVSGSRDKTLRLWDLEGNAVGLPFGGHGGSVRSVAFSPQGDRIISCSDDSTLRLWDLAGNAIGSPFVGHSDWVTSVAFSPSGDRIVSGSGDNTLRLWDLEGHAIGSPFEGHSDEVFSVAFGPQGDQIFSGSRDTTLRLWRVGSWKDELRYCCNTLMRHPALTLRQTETARKACKVCQQVWTRQQSAEFAVAQGSVLAQRGEVEAAIAKFDEAKRLDAELTLDPVRRANELAEWSGAK